jgi:hypothetical protein
MRSTFLMLLTLLIALPAQAGPLSAEKRRRVEQAADRMPDDVVMYRWQSKASGEKLISEKSFTDKLYDYFMGMEDDGAHFAAGRGIYAAENPHSSSQFVRGDDDGSLIEVRIAKGTPYLDMEDPKTVQRLAKLGISPADVTSGVPEPRVAVKYNGESKWWVLKGQDGVSFRAFDGSRLKPSYLISTYSRLNGGKPKFIYANAVLGRLFGLAQEDPELLTKLPVREMLGPQNTIALFDDLLDKARSQEDLARLRGLAKDSGSIRDHLAKNAERAKTFRAREMEFFSLADHLKDLGNAGPGNLKEEVRKWFRTVDRAHIYARDLDGLADFVQTRPELMIELAMDSALPGSIKASGEEAKKIAAAKQRLRLSDGQLSEFVQKGNGPFEQFTRAERALAYAEKLDLDAPGRTRLDQTRSELLKKVRDQLPSLQGMPIKARLAEVEKVMPAISSADTLLKLLETGGEFEAERPAARFVAANADAIFALPLNPLQRRGLLTVVQADFDSLQKVLPRFIQAADGADELVSLLVTQAPDLSYSDQASRYWDTVAANRDAIYAKKPSPAQLLKIQGLRAGGVDQADKVVDFLWPAIEKARGVGDLVELLQDPFFKRWDAQRGALGRAIEKNWDMIRKKISSLADAEALLPYTMYGSRMKVTEAGMAYTQNAKELTSFLSKAAKDQGPAFADTLATHLNIEFASVSAKGLSPAQWGEIMSPMNYGDSRAHLYRKLFHHYRDGSDFMTFAAKASNSPITAEMDAAVVKKMIPELLEKKLSEAQLRKLATLYWPDYPEQFLGQPPVAAYLKTAPKGTLGCGGFFAKLSSLF